MSMRLASGSTSAHHWPDVPNLGDITKVDWRAMKAASGGGDANGSLADIDVMTGGFP